MRIEEDKSTASVDDDSLDMGGDEQSSANASGMTNDPVVLVDTCDIAIPNLDQPTYEDQG